MSEIKPWQEISQESVFQKYSRKIKKIIFELPSGKQSDFYIKDEGSAAAIFAMTPDKQVILVKQFRPGPKKILFEIPGGGIDKNETPIQAGARELLEETGYKGDVKLVTECLDCAYSTMNRYCLIAINCQKIQEPQNNPEEPCETILMPIEDFRKLLRSGQMTDVEVGYLALDYLSLL